MSTVTKVMLDGKAGVGKTTMVCKLIGLDKEICPTLGVEVHPWWAGHGQCLNIWDLSGSHPGLNPSLYWTGASARIHMIDNLGDVPQAHLVAENSPIPVLLLFNDRDGSRPHVPGFHLVNAKTGRGVEDALRTLLPA